MPIETKNKFKLPQRPKKLGRSLLALGIFLLVLNFVILPAFRPRPLTVLYSQFLKAVKEGKVSQALVEPGRILFILKQGSTEGVNRNDQLDRKTLGTVHD